MQFDWLVFLGDGTTAWLYQQNDYPAAVKARQYLVENKTGARFNGAFKVSVEQLPEFARHLFWLTRCNASLPWIHFSDGQQQVLGSICQYGNLHFNTRSEAADTLFKRALAKSSFIPLGEGAQCGESFSKKGAIKGRQTTR
jgi:hypothetical protein